ncbi:MAG: glycosyltransferase family 2 protein [Vicinamibacterales bacterium]
MTSSSPLPAIGSPSLRLSVILPVTHSWPALAVALESSVRQDFDEPFEVVVVDGHGAALDREPQPPVRWIRAPGADVFALRAIGASEARGEIVLFNEDHCVVPPDWCARVSAAHMANTTPILIGEVRNHVDSSRRAVDRANFALTCGPFAPPLSAVPRWRLPIPTNLSIKRTAFPVARPADGWIEYELLADGLARGTIGVATDTAIDHLQHWGMLMAVIVHFASGRSYGAWIRQWPRTRRRDWWRQVASQTGRLYRSTVPVIENHGAGARSSWADRCWLWALVLANSAGQMTGALVGSGSSRRHLV